MTPDNCTIRVEWEDWVVDFRRRIVVAVSAPDPREAAAHATALVELLKAQDGTPCGLPVVGPNTTTCAPENT